MSLVVGISDYHALAQQLLPGGVGRSTFALGAPPPVAVRGAGYRIWDDHGRESIDLNNNFTALVHGHAHEAIVAAATEALKNGASFGLPNLSELRHAQILMDRLPGFGQVRYTNSGTEATMLAVRVARARTGRDACLFVRDAYHGSGDAVLATGTKHYERGLTRGTLRDSVNVPVNDLDRLSEAVSSEPDRFAALVVDPMPNRAGLMPLSAEFISLINALCQEHGILLVADEIVAFRFRYGGLAVDRGLKPDLLALGKLIGGGLPIGALVGRPDVMAELDPAGPSGLEHGGTFSANPVVMEAGVVALDLLDEPTIERMNQLGDQARRQLGNEIERFGWEVRGQGSAFRPFSPDGDQMSCARRQLQVWWEAYLRGVLLTPQALATVSSPMDESVLADVVERLSDAIAAVATGRDRRSSV